MDSSSAVVIVVFSCAMVGLITILSRVIISECRTSHNQEPNEDILMNRPRADGSQDLARTSTIELRYKTQSTTTTPLE